MNLYFKRSMLFLRWNLKEKRNIGEDWNEILIDSILLKSRIEKKDDENASGSER